MPDKEVVFDATINEDGIKITAEKSSGEKVKTSFTNKPKKKNILKKVANLVDSCGLLLSLVAYILCGTLGGLWHCAWVLFFVPNIASSILRAIAKKDLKYVNITFVAAFVFFFVCMWCPGASASLWHPMWVVFLAIPIYYSAVHSIKSFGAED